MGKNKHVETKHATKKPMGQWKNQRGNQKITWDKRKWKHDYPNLWNAAKEALRGKFMAKSMGCHKISFKREVYGNSGFPLETRNISSKQPNLSLKGIRKRKKKSQRAKSAEGKK